MKIVNLESTYKQSRPLHVCKFRPTCTVLVRMSVGFLINIIDPGWPLDAEGQHCEVIRLMAAHWTRADEERRENKDRQTD